MKIPSKVLFVYGVLVCVQKVSKVQKGPLLKERSVRCVHIVAELLHGSFGRALDFRK